MRLNDTNMMFVIASPGGGCNVMKASPGGGCVLMKASPGGGCNVMKASPGGGCSVMKGWFFPSPASFPFLFSFWLCLILIERE